MDQLTDFFKKLFDSTDWPPRWHCGHWTEFHGWLYIVSDLLIWSAYFTIPLVIIRFISKKKDIKFIRIYFLFAAFILACGATHFLDALAFWIPAYRLNAFFRAITGVISWVTVFQLVNILPKLSSLRSQQDLEIEIEQRKKTEEKFRGLLEAAPDAMVITNEKGEIVLINRQTENLFGYAKEELIGQAVEILIPAAFHSKHVVDRIHYFESPKVRTMGAGLKLFAKRKDGSEVPVEISLSPLITSEGTLVSASIRDITERKKAEAKLIEAKEDFQLLVSSVKDYAIFMLDKEGHVATWNSGAEHLKGYTAEEIIGKSMDIFYTGEDMKNGEPKRNLQRALEKGHFETEGWRVRKDGSLFFADIAFTPLIDEEGKLYGYAKVTKDITEKRKAEERMRFLASIADNIQDPVISTTNSDNNNFIITRWNKPAEKLLEWKSEEVIGKNAAEIFKTSYPDESREQIFEMLKSKGFWQGEVVYHTKSNRPVHVLSTISYIKDAGGKITGYLVLARDISQRKKAEAALSKLNGELEAFTYSVSHDLRAPLRGIIGFTAILEEDYANKLDEEARRITTVIKENAMKMGHLIDDLLAFSRMGKQPITKAEIDTDTMVKEIIYDLTVQQKNDKPISWDIRDLLPMNADMNTIRQVWVNLISNAIKYSGNEVKPHIEIGSYSKENQSVFYVQDNGVGFDEKYKEKLFKVFQRLHSHEEFEGTGVGLALVEKIVSKHGGKVWANGEINIGACFSFSLPA